MANPLSDIEISAIVRKATKDRYVYVHARQKDDPTTALQIEGRVTEVTDTFFRFHPEGHEDAEATARVPDGRADTQYLSITFKNAETHKDVDMFTMKRPGLQTNSLGIIEYEPKTWVKAIQSAHKANVPMLTQMISSILDAFFFTSPRAPGSHGTLTPQDEEMSNARDTFSAFLEYASTMEVTQGVYRMVQPSLLRLCAIRRARGTEGEKRKKILAKAYSIQMLTDAKKREEEWIKYNSQTLGSEPSN